MAQAQKKPDKDVVVHNIYAELITVYHLPQDLYFYNADQLMQAVRKSFPTIQFKYNSPDLKLYEAIHDNIYLFSGAKTFQQTLAMSEEITKGGRMVPFEEFKAQAGKIFDEYNDTWLRTEYETAKDSARMAEKWLGFEKNKAANPLLMYVTEHDETVCDICGPLDGITLPVGDPFWDSNYPPLHFNCHCDVEAGDDPEEESEDNEVDTAEADSKSEKEARFSNNAGKSGQVFSNNHPYFTIPKEFRTLAERNFGLPIPPIR